MRKYITYILISLLALTALPVRAVTYQGLYQTTPTSRYERNMYDQNSTYAPVESSFGSTSAYNKSMARTSSFSAISASNFSSLNGEGGELDQSSSRPGARKGRPGGGSSGGGGAIGEYDFHSPVGDVPWWLFAIMAAIYALYVFFSRSRKSDR